MKTIRPINDAEIEFFRWMIFEPLRRNKAYQKAYADFVSNPLEDPFQKLKRGIDFCNKWKTPCSFDPSSDWASFRGPWKKETEDKARRRIQGTILGIYVSLSDRAVLVPFDDVIVNGKYLRLAIDLRKSRNRIESDVREELDSWQRDAWTKDFHGKRLRRISETEILTFSVRDSWMRLHINLEAPRRSIDRKIAEVLSVELLKWRTKSRGSENRFHPEKWKEYFDVYDRVQKGKTSLHNISKALHSPIKTIRRQYQRAWEAINGKSYPKTIITKKTGKEFISAEKLIAFCDNCTKRTCDETGQACKKLLNRQSKDSKNIREELPKEFIAKEKERIPKPNKGQKPQRLSADRQSS